MKYLFIHTNYPSQFRRLAPALADQGHEVIFMAQNREWHAPSSKNIKLKRYETHRDGGSEYLHPYLRRFDKAVLIGQAVFRACNELTNEGWEPDWIINHVGFGCGLYLNDAFPNAQRAGLFEWYYNAFGSDVEFLNHGKVEPDRQLRLRTWNAQTLMELADVDVAITPTNWQKKQFPTQLQEKISVVHEGIDWSLLSQLRDKRTKKPESIASFSKYELVSYVSRGFEEYRGFPQAVKALAMLQKRRPNVHVMIAGSDIAAYGPTRGDGRTWGQWAKEDSMLDPDRTHWLGAIQEKEYHQLLAWSDVHLYLTVPFVLSWSLLEAMAAGCSIVASNTPPVLEAISNEQEGLLVDFFDSNAQAKAMERLLVDRKLAERLGIRAQKASHHYDSVQGREKWKKILSESQNSRQ